MSKHRMRIGAKSQKKAVLMRIGIIHNIFYSAMRRYDKDLKKARSEGYQGLIPPSLKEELMKTNIFRYE